MEQMPWYSVFKSFTNKLFPLWLGGKKYKIPDSENNDKHNWYEFPCASLLVKCLVDFEKKTDF